jgi:hypothetical protein
MFPMIVVENESVKYLGLILKLDNYKYVDWMWLYNKIEARISLWCARWLSRSEKK